MDSDPSPPSFHAKIFDGPVIAHILSTEAKTFDQYGTDIFLPWTKRVLQKVPGLTLFGTLTKLIVSRNSQEKSEVMGLRGK